MGEAEFGEHGEPWRVFVDYDQHACYFETSFPKDHIVSTYWQNHRIVECVNTLDGIPNPAEYRAAVDALREAAKLALSVGRDGMTIVNRDVWKDLEAALARLESGEGE